MHPRAWPTTLRRVPPLWVLLAATAVLYLWGLSASGWANAYYSAAAQSGAESWRAFFFGAFDSAGSITVDKPPLGVWPMALSVRLFGLSSWSLLVPQALMGVATVALVHHGVRRATGSSKAALVAGAAFALTPVAVLMFRFNNPDCLLVLLLVGAAVAVLHALDSPRAVWWLALAGSLVGLGFLTKMLQAFLVLPALGLVYLLYAAVPLGRRIGHLLVAGAAMVVAGSWWIVAVELWPAASRPFIGGSQSNSALELVIGYNGVGRLTGAQTGSVSGPAGFGSNTVFRLFDPSSGGQASWLLPAALVLGVGALWLSRGTALRARPAIVLWLTWTGVQWTVFSLMGGIFHDYYTVALVPGIASLFAIGAHTVWHRRAERAATYIFGGAVAVSGVVAMVVLWPQRDWQPWLPWVALTLLVATVWRVAVAHRRAVPVGLGFAATALLAAAVGPAAYSVETAATGHTGAIPHAGPSKQTESPYVGTTAVGSLLDAGTPPPSVVRLLSEDAADFTWVAAVTGANSAAGFQLATDHPVMPLGGFNGTDPNPTLTRFRQLVDDDRIHWFIGGGGRFDVDADGERQEVTRTGSEDAVLIERWVARHYPAQVIGGITLYDLTGPAFVYASQAADS